RNNSLARTNRTHHSAPSSNGSPTVESVVAIVRTLWTAVEGAAEAEKAKLKKDISQTVNRLKNRVESRLGAPVVAAARERGLFEEQDQQGFQETEVAVPSAPPRFAEPVLRVYAKDFADHALQHLPQAVKYHSVEGFASIWPRSSVSTPRRPAAGRPTT